MPLDKNQTKAVQTVGTNILVSASAGAGKTGVLVSRLIKRCLVDKVSLDEILAVTFTAAAAGEMKNRVASRLQEEYQKEDSEKNGLKNRWYYSLQRISQRLMLSAKPSLRNTIT